MKRLALLPIALVTLVPAIAFAQDRQEPSPPAAAPSPAPAPAAVPSPSCALGDHEGFEEADARTSAQLVCAEIGRAGAQPGTHYRVSLGKLGAATILSVAREGDTPGSTADSREMRLQTIEEVMVAAPRIAESIVKGTPLTETEKVDNLVGQETRQPKSKPGKTHFALGLVGLLPPLDQGLTPAPGIDLDVHYETGSQQFEVGGSMRFGGGNGGSRTTVSNGFFIFSVGGRWFTADTDISPYLGGGLSWSYLSLHAPDSGVDANNNGLGAFVDGGVQIMRTHHAHLALGARLDVPFFTLNNNRSEVPTYSYNGTQNPPSVSGPSTFYYAPLSVELRLTF
jgi:hypothetical protein